MRPDVIEAHLASLAGSGTKEGLFGVASGLPGGLSGLLEDLAVLPLRDFTFGIRACELRAAGRSQGHNRACFRCGWPGHRTAVARVVDARCDWMEARGLPSWRGARGDLVAQRDNPEWDMWVLDDEATGVIGQTVVQRQGPSWGWTDAERAEPAL